MAIVYRHRRLDNNEIFYIGIGKEEKRAFSKEKRNNLWFKIINKIDYQVEIIAKDLDFEDAKELEILLIKEYGRKDLGTGTLSNLTDGGEGTLNYKFSDERKKSVSDRFKGEKNHNYGKSMNEDTKDKMRLTIAKNITTKNINTDGIIILDIETGIYYNSIKEAANYNNWSRRHLGYMLNGKYKNKTNLKIV